MLAGWADLACSPQVVGYVVLGGEAQVRLAGLLLVEAALASSMACNSRPRLLFRRLGCRMATCCCGGPPAPCRQPPLGLHHLGLVGRVRYEVGSQRGPVLRLSGLCLSSQRGLVLRLSELLPLFTERPRVEALISEPLPLFIERSGVEAFRASASLHREAQC